MTLEVFVPGPLHNPLNGTHGHWAKHAKWAKQWRERTHLALFAAHWTRSQTWRVPDRDRPKHITFTAQTGARWDDDNLRAGLKPCRDALKDAGLIADDGPTAGHVFCYAQVVNRHHRGVRITITEAPVRAVQPQEGPSERQAIPNHEAPRE